MMSRQEFTTRTQEKPVHYITQSGRLIVHVDLKETNSEIERVNSLCHATEVRNWTDCNHFREMAKDSFNRILKSEEQVVKELIGDGQSLTRKRRGILNFVGEISKILLGTLDNDDAEYYNEQIRRSEDNSEDLTSLMKQQLSIVKASLGTTNDSFRYGI